MEIQRKEQQALRWRLLYGMAHEDIRRRLIESVGRTRMAAWGPLDMTSNPFLSVWSQAAASYRVAPRVTAPEEVAAALEACGHWSLMQRVQRDTLGLREMVVRLEHDPETGELLTVPVPPYLVEVEVDPRNPYRALSVTEQRPDPDDPKQKIKVICNPGDRVYMAVDEQGKDVSGRVLGGNMSGEAYPYDGPDGPILPYVTYRAALTGSYWDPFTGVELVECSLQLSVLYCFYVHMVKDCSWPQRYAVDLEPAGIQGAPDSGEGVITDPSTLLLLKRSGTSDAPGQIGQWAASSDPEATLRSIQAYERRAVDAALGTANVSRSNSDIRSAASLVVSREDQRELQKSYEPVFRRADLELLTKAGQLLGYSADEAYDIEYRAVPKAPAELRAEVESLAKAVEAGLKSRLDAYLELHPKMSEDDARAALAVIDASRSPNE